MKFLEWVTNCEESCIGRRSHWEFYRSEIQGDVLVVIGKKVRHVKVVEIGRFQLPERVVELAVPSWVYTVNYMLEFHASDGIPVGSFDANAARTISMFLSEALSAKAGYTGRTLRVRAGNLWGAMCRLTTHGVLRYETLCDSCGGHVEDEGGTKRPKCSHPHPSMGYRLVLIRYTSILDNLEVLRQLEFQKSRSVKQDYMYLLNGLNGQPS